MRTRLPLGVLLLCLLNCQDYPFEQRLPLRAAGHSVTQAVATVTPTDILFVIDNSGSMKAQRAALAAQMGNFVAEMASSTDAFHLGIITTDVDCNLPGRQAACAAGTANEYCCPLHYATNSTTQAGDCNQQRDANGSVVYSDCDGGRLRSLQGLSPYFSPPASAAEQNQWITNVSQTINGLGCQGSSYESGLEAARRAIACSLNMDECADPNVAQLNAGFIRPDADLVIIFVSDEDDCSFSDPNTYMSPSDPTDDATQAAHVFSPQECYSYYDKGDVDTSTGLQAWSETYYSYRYNNASYMRTADPPNPDDPNGYIDFFIAAKGNDITKVRAAGIVSAMNNNNTLLGMSGSACYNPGAGPSNACGCWSSSYVPQNSNSGGAIYCALTKKTGLGGIATPPSTTAPECSSAGTGSPNTVTPAGCKAMPGNRYVSVLESLSTRRTTAKLSSDTLLDSICNGSYSDTMFDIVNTIILTSCFNLNEVPNDVSSIVVQLNGTTLTNVPVGSSTKGWSWVPGTSQICLEGGLKKSIGDTFNIFIMDAVTTPN